MIIAVFLQYVHQEGRPTIDKNKERPPETSGLPCFVIAISPRAASIAENKEKKKMHPCILNRSAVFEGALFFFLTSHFQSPVNEEGLSSTQVLGCHTFSRDPFSRDAFPFLHMRAICSLRERTKLTNRPPEVSVRRYSSPFKPVAASPLDSWWPI